MQSPKKHWDHLDTAFHADYGILLFCFGFVGLAYQGKDIVFRFIIEYSSLRAFGP